MAMAIIWKEDALDLVRETPRESTPQITCAGNAGVFVIDRPKICYRARCSCTPRFLVYCAHTIEGSAADYILIPHPYHPHFTSSTSINHPTLFSHLGLGSYPETVVLLDLSEFFQKQSCISESGPLHLFHQGT